MKLSKDLQHAYATHLTPLLSDERLALLRQILGPAAKLHLVGGTVRDALLGLPAKDLDLATALHPDEVREKLAAAKLECYPTGLKHQTVTVKPVRELGHLEITTFRGPNMTPQGGVVSAASIEEDLKYRDFTVNALALSLDEEQLVEGGTGISDIETRSLRAAGAPEERFREDPLRMLRMVRLACELDFKVEERTFAAAEHLAKELTQVSIERIRDEFTKTLCSEHPDRGLDMLAKLGLLELFLPEVSRFVDFEQNRFHKADLFRHTLEVVKRSRSDTTLRLAALFHDVGKPDTLSTDEAGDRHFFRHESVGAKATKEILKRLKYSNEIAHDVAILVATHMRPLNAGAAGLRRLLRDTAELYPLWRELKEADAKACKLSSDEVDDALREFDVTMAEVERGPKVSPLKNLAVNGDDLLALGFDEGPELGKALHALHERVLDEPELNKREILLALAKKLK